ncbi:MAG: TVP38/TMEM64 family protein, partial [Rhodospirillaceae bacterium]|nr:TVP38/TMEM64 family protein [Rhodospirillaceae bacterium]
MSDSDCGKPTSQCPPAPRRRIVRCLPLAVLAGGLVLVLVFGVHDLISLSALRENRQDLTDFVADNLVVAAAAYMAVYALATALSVPGGAILTLVGGFLFGVVIGGVLVVV